MSVLRFFTDEDIYAAIASALRSADLNAVSTPEVNQLGASDESQLEWATSESRVLVTFNVAHFAYLHTVWTQQGKRHAGIVVSIQQPIGEMLRRLLNLAGTLDADAFDNRLEYLGDW